MRHRSKKQFFNKFKNMMMKPYVSRSLHWQTSLRRITSKNSTIRQEIQINKDLHASSFKSSFHRFFSSWSTSVNSICAIYYHVHIFVVAYCSMIVVTMLRFEFVTESPKINSPNFNFHDVPTLKFTKHDSGLPIQNACCWFLILLVISPIVFFVSILADI